MGSPAPDKDGSPPRSRLPRLLSVAILILITLAISGRVAIQRWLRRPQFTAAQEAWIAEQAARIKGYGLAGRTYAEAEAIAARELDRRRELVIKQAGGEPDPRPLFKVMNFEDGLFAYPGGEWVYAVNHSFHWEAPNGDRSKALNDLTVLFDSRGRFFVSRMHLCMGFRKEETFQTLDELSSNPSWFPYQP